MTENALPVDGQLSKLSADTPVAGRVVPDDGGPIVVDGLFGWAEEAVWVWEGVVGRPLSASDVRFSIDRTDCGPRDGPGVLHAVPHRETPSVHHRPPSAWRVKPPPAPRGPVMSHVRSSAALLLVAIATASAQTAPGPWRRTETREPCASFDVFRQPFFGDTHVHTACSSDTVFAGTIEDPRGAYRFAQGQAIGLPPCDAFGAPARTAQLRRPLDFTAVTDHAEQFGVSNPPERFPWCGTGCATEASLVWEDTQAAAEEFYDRNAACTFTTFVGYE